MSTAALARHRGAPQAARVGPNAVIQLAAALRASGDDTAGAVFAAAGCAAWFEQPPLAMVSEREVAALHATLFRLRPGTAAGIAADAGRRTADYLLAHRIPRPVQWLLRRLPAAPAARLLLGAIRSNAWTFAGSGTVTVHPGRPCVIAIAANPLAVAGCAWHVAVFERLFRSLIDPAARVGETACCARQAPACRFEIGWP